MYTVVSNMGTHSSMVSTSVMTRRVVRSDSLRPSCDGSVMRTRPNDFTPAAAAAEDAAAPVVVAGLPECTAVPGSSTSMLLERRLEPSTAGASSGLDTLEASDATEERLPLVATTAAVALACLYSFRIRNSRTRRMMRPARVPARDARPARMALVAVTADVPKTRFHSQPMSGIMLVKGKG